MKESPREWNAKISSTMLGVEDHGAMTFMIHLEGNGIGQGAGGYCLDGYNKLRDCREGWGPGIMMIRRLLEVVGVEKWEDLKGKYVRVRSTFDKVHALGHITNEDWLDFSRFVEENKVK